jgi:glycosyltransferase involved in cell wall biosynthesis
MWRSLPTARRLHGGRALMKETRTIAYFGRPHLGGTYSVYRQLRDGLHKSGWSVRWVGLGQDAGKLNVPDLWASEWACGEVVAPGCADEREQAQAFLEHLETTGYDAVIANVLANRVQTNALRYLDRRIGRLMIVHSTSPGTYAAASSIRDHVHAIVGVSPRIRDDLVLRRGFPRAHTHAIATAFNAPLFDGLERRPHTGPIRLLSLGRLENDSKGLFWIPSILGNLGDLPFTLTIAGEGRDGPELRKRLERFSSRVRFTGMLAPEKVATVMAEHDVFLLPSRYEGQAITLVEALASGCVPIASHLRGVTNFAIDDEETGFLFPVGDTLAAARFIQRLDGDRGMLARMSQSARKAAYMRFRPDLMSGAYADLIQNIKVNPRALAAPLRGMQWRLPSGLRAGPRTWLPNPLKNKLRQLRESWAS